MDTAVANLFPPLRLTARTATQPRSCELSIVLPCLDEARTVGLCVQKARAWLAANEVAGEVIVADNGSTDSSVEIARAAGAQVITVRTPGYGCALMGGIAAARGEFVIMGDADDSYDFSALDELLENLRAGYDLVQGCRLPAGGGAVLPGAMPALHRWIGNPLFSRLVRWWFRAPIHDVYCGLRGFRKTAYDALALRCGGMEFATEMIIKASLFGLRISEVPITLHPDGRGGRRSHLKTYRDGWRTLRFFLLCSPRALFFTPGFAACLSGLLLYALVYGRVALGGAHFDVHSLLLGSLAIITGHKCFFLFLFAKVFATNEGFLPPDRRLDAFFRRYDLEKSLLVSAGSALAGVMLWVWAFAHWWQADFGNLNYSATMRIVVPGALLIVLGLNTVVDSFMISVLSLKRHSAPANAVVESPAAGA